MHDIFLDILFISINNNYYKLNIFIHIYMILIKTVPINIIIIKIILSEFIENTVKKY